MVTNADNTIYRQHFTFFAKVSEERSKYTMHSAFVCSKKG